VIKRALEASALLRDSKRIPRGRSGTALEALVRVTQLGPVLVLLLIGVVIYIAEPIFLTERNLKDLAVQASPIALLAIGQLVVIITRGIDLSVGSIIAVVSVLGALMFERGESALLTLAVMLGAAALSGFITGAIITYGRIRNPFIVTLGMLSLLSGVALKISGGRSRSGVPEIVKSLGQDQWLGVPLPVLLCGATAAVFAVILHFTRFGRWLYAIGGNPEAAARVGIPSNRVLLAAYILCGLCAGLAAVVIAGRANAGYPTAGFHAELDAISAVVIGGASFFGGRGRVVNALVGAATIATIRNGLNLTGVAPDWQVVVLGAVLIAAVGMDTLRFWLEDRLRSHYAAGGQ
jgi:ribose transport system permease protein